MRPLEAELREGAAALELILEERQIAQCLDYLDLMSKWNAVYNLTAIREPALMLTHHLLDSLGIVKPLLRETHTSAFRLLDVGAGAGLPGVVLAIALPQAHIECVDAVAKKARFIQQAAMTLGLSHLKGVHTRVEQYHAEPFDVVTSRAFASLNDFVRLTRAQRKASGLWLAMKGKPPHEEIAMLPDDIDVFHVEPLHIPGLDADRTLVWMRCK